MATSQSGKSYIVSFIPQVTIGTPVTGAGGKVVRTLASPGFTLSRPAIDSKEIRADGFYGAPRKGVKSAPGSYTCELSYGTFDALMAAFLRSTFAGGPGAMTPGTTKKFFTFDQYLEDLDLSMQIETVRILSMGVKVPAAGMVTIDFGLLGRNAVALASGASPSLTAPTLTTTDQMAGIDATISVPGGAQYSSCDFSCVRSGAVEALIGTALSPDVYDGSAAGSGTLTGTLESLALLTTVGADASTTVTVTCIDAIGNSIAFALAGVQLLDFNAPLGADGAMIMSSKFTFGGATALTITNTDHI